MLEKVLGFDNDSRGYLDRIYKAGEGSSKESFLKSIDGKEELVFIIEVFEDNKYIGVYTAARINTVQHFNEDYESFIFSFEKPTKFKTLKPS